MRQTRLIYLLGLQILLTTSIARASETSLKIRGDSSYWDIPNNQMKYIGNAVFSNPNLTIKGDEIIAQKQSNGTDESIEVKGKPAEFNERPSLTQQRTQLSAGNIRYLVNKKIITARNNVQLNQIDANSDSIDITGNQLQINQAKSYRLSVSGSPLTVKITQAGQAPISAQASNLSYNRGTEQFELEGQVTLTSLRETMKAEKVLYNMKTGILQVPKSPNKQVEIIQSKNNNDE